MGDRRVDKLWRWDDRWGKREGHVEFRPNDLTTTMDLEVFALGRGCRGESGRKRKGPLLNISVGERDAEVRGSGNHAGNPLRRGRGLEERRQDLG